MNMVVIYILMVLKFMMTSKHILLSLLSLEGMMVAVMYFISKVFMSGYLSMFGVLTFLVVVVGEGVSGLGIMVMMVRGLGSDNFFFMNLL